MKSSSSIVRAKDGGSRERDNFCTEIYYFSFYVFVVELFNIASVYCIASVGQVSSGLIKGCFHSQLINGRWNYINDWYI